MSSIANRERKSDTSKTQSAEDQSTMADTRKVEEGNAFSEKRKLDFPNSINKTPEEKEEVNEEDNSNSTKKQKLEITPENEKDAISALVIDDKVVESKGGKENCKADETDDQDEHHKVEPEMVNRENKIPMVDKGKGILIEESEEADEEEDDDFYSDLSDGFNTHSEDDTI